MIIYKPYTYLIGWSKYNYWYYGVQHASSTKRLANPKNLWTTYYTSSKTVALARTIFGEPDVIQVRKTFDNAFQAREWEHRVLKRLNVVNSNKWLNASDARSIPSQKGIRKSAKHNLKNSISHIGARNPFYGKTHTEEYKQKLSTQMSGCGNHMYGQTHSYDSREKIAQARSATWIITNGTTEIEISNLTKFCRDLGIQCYQLRKGHRCDALGEGVWRCFKTSYRS